MSINQFEDITAIERAAMERGRKEVVEWIHSHPICFGHTIGFGSDEDNTQIRMREWKAQLKEWGISESSLLGKGDKGK
ncbi:MAG: hypothetical protein MUP81_04850 [Dehalococcoidia bacterium]|nr:hypothetical protein [Dehalococcoidia bacterium]